MQDVPYLLEVFPFGIVAWREARVVVSRSSLQSGLYICLSPVLSDKLSQRVVVDSERKYLCAGAVTCPWSLWGLDCISPASTRSVTPVRRYINSTASSALKRNALNPSHNGDARRPRCRETLRSSTLSRGSISMSTLDFASLWTSLRSDTTSSPLSSDFIWDRLWITENLQAEDGPV